MQLGAPAMDAPIRQAGRDDWFLRQVGSTFTLLCFDPAGPIEMPGVSVLVLGETEIVDVAGLLARRYDARPGTVYLLRPDQHVCARWRAFDPAAVRAALRRACGH
jgi:3-(3-hydroxy-phenyl)propionate hydroxylase